LGQGFLPSDRSAALGPNGVSASLGELEQETRAFASQTPLTLEDEERTLLMEFVELRSRDFTGRAALLDQLHGIATGPVTDGEDWGACVNGLPGSGKSAIFAQLWKRLADEPVLLLGNAAGGTPSGSQPDAMLRRFIQELASFLKITNPLQNDASFDDADLTFASLLARTAAHKRTVVLLDALDQFDPSPRGRYLTWLRPEHWPANARLIATSLPSTAAVRLSQCAGIRQLEIPPLTDEDITEIARRVWARYHRQLNLAVIRILGDKLLSDATSAASIPLWLTLALEQLNLLDGDDFVSAERRFIGTPAERLRDLVMDTAHRMPPTVQELYDWLLAHTEKAYGAPHARAFASLIAISRFGWREADLLQLVPRVARLLYPSRSLPEFDELGLASLRRGFRAHLVRRGVFGQIDFFHAQMRETVRHRALEDLEVQKQIHSAIAGHLESLPPEDPLRQTEQMVHLIAADDAPNTARVYADLPDPSIALTAATEALARHIRIAASQQQQNSNLVWSAALFTQPGLCDQQTAALARHFVFDLTSVFEETADLSVRKALLEEGLHAFERLVASDPGVASWQRNLSASQIKLGEVLLAEGRSNGALELYRASLSIAESLVGGNSSDRGWLRDLSVSQQKVADVLRKQGNHAEALKTYQQSLSIARHAAEAYPDDGDWQRDFLDFLLSSGGCLRKERRCRGVTLVANSLRRLK
jgi:tetratricopeptide (TPR) repeat protein